MVPVVGYQGTQPGHRTAWSVSHQDVPSERLRPLHPTEKKMVQNIDEMELALAKKASLRCGFFLIIFTF